MNLADISWEECKEYIARDNRVILPIGSTEAHGRHLGLGCDYQLAEGIANAVGERTGILVAPVQPYGMSYPLTEFPGTLSLAPDTMTHLIADLFRSLYRSGFRRILVVNGHGGNDAPLRTARIAVADELPELQVKLASWWTEPEVTRLVDEAAGPQRGTHASTHETAFLMAVKPEAVKMQRAARRDAPVEPSHALTDAKDYARLYPDGVLGLDPSRATPELGRRIFEKAVELSVAAAQEW